MSLKVVTDLNELNKLLGAVWQLPDGAPVTLSIPRPGPLRAGIMPPPSDRGPALDLSAGGWLRWSAMGRQASYYWPTSRVFRLGDLRAVCLKATGLALGAPSRAGAFEVVVLGFPKGAMTVRCAGKEWTLKEQPPAPPGG